MCRSRIGAPELLSRLNRALDDGAGFEIAHLHAYLCAAAADLQMVVLEDRPQVAVDLDREAAPQITG